MKFMPQIVLLTGREAFGKKPGKLALRGGEVYYEKTPGQVCNNYFFKFSYYYLTIIYNSVIYEQRHQHQLRHHLCHCLKNKTINLFPCQQ